MPRVRPQSLCLSVCFLSRSWITTTPRSSASRRLFACRSQTSQVPTNIRPVTPLTPLRSMSSVQEPSDEVRSQKQALRKDIRAKLKSLPRSEIEHQSIAVWNRLKDLAAYRNAKSIGLFLSMPAGEINTDPALQHAVTNGKEIYVPQVGANFELADMELVKVQTASSNEHELFHHSWPKNKWGIPEPPADMLLNTAEPGDIDVLIVPGLAFDRCGNRLGQGKGYYDRFIERMFADATKKPPVLIAVGLECQVVDDFVKIPVHEHDFPVQWVLLPNETIQVEK